MGIGVRRGVVQSRVRPPVGRGAGRL